MQYEIQPLINKSLLLSISPSNPTELMNRQFEKGGRIILMDDDNNVIEKFDYEPDAGMKSAEFRRMLSLEALKMTMEGSR